MARNPKGSSAWDHHIEPGSGTPVLWDYVIILDRDPLLGQNQWSSGWVGVGGSRWVPSPAFVHNILVKSHRLCFHLWEHKGVFEPWFLLPSGAPGVSPGAELQLREHWGGRATWQVWSWTDAQRSRRTKVWLPQHCQTVLTFLTQPLIHKVRLKKKTSLNAGRAWFQYHFWGICIQILEQFQHIFPILKLLNEA